MSLRFRISILAVLIAGLLPILAIANGDGHDHENGGVPEAKQAHFVGDGHTDHTHTPLSREPWFQNNTWWGLFLGSILLMVLLSWGVWRFLQIKH